MGIGTGVTWLTHATRGRPGTAGRPADFLQRRNLVPSVGVDIMGTLVFKPDEIYRNVRNVAPDLIAHFGALYWRSIGGVGYGRLHIQENDTGPDDCNHAQYGAFILAASNLPLQGEVTGARLLDVAPTLLELGGYDVPSSMQGRSLVAGISRQPPSAASADGEAIIKERLAGLGYIS